MSELQGPDTKQKKVTITITNVPFGLWQAFQDEARRQNNNVTSFIVSLMAGATDYDLGGEQGR